MEGRLPGPEVERIEQHLAVCRACRALQRALATVTNEPSHPVASSRTVEALGRGATIGRYLVLSQIGKGGMGEVYAAYDPELDRRVALKLLYTTRRSEDAKKRLWREARALGKLSHPNVVHVYDVGEHQGRVFVAMELVEGASLAVYCRTDPKPSWQAILSAYLDAARGIAAAHEKGLVHRDVKPSNILRGKDGHVRVADFGLVTDRERGDREPDDTPGDLGADARTPALEETLPMHASTDDDGRLTRTGAVLGTPIYMAPEQFGGVEVSAASDQHSLCTALYVSLYGRVPFDVEPGATMLTQILAGKREGPPPSPPSGTEVPTWVYRALARGLAPRPEDRYPSVQDLIAALCDDPGARRRARWVRAGMGGAAALLLVAVAAAGWLGGSAFKDPCAHPERKLAGVWDAPTRERVRGAFEATGRAYAGDTAARVAAILDGYGASWASMRGEVCEAARGAHDRPASAALREACLERRRGQLGALAALFAGTPDAEVVDKAVSAAANLPPISYCADVEALAARVPPPEDPAIRARVAEIQPKIDDLVALRLSGKYKEALARGERLLAETPGLGFAPVRAHVEVVVGELRDDTGDYAGAASLLATGAATAAEGKDDLLVGEAMASLLRAAVYHQNHFEEAPALLTAGRVAAARAGDPRTQARWLNVEGNVLRIMHRPEESLSAFDRALALDEKALGPLHIDVAHLVENRAATFEVMRDFPRARADYERAGAVLKDALGPDHPDLAALQYDLALMLDDSGELREALALYERALALRERTLGPDHPAVAQTLNNLGVVLLEVGEAPRAKEMLERALAIKEKRLDGRSRGLAVSIDTVARAHFALGEYARAREVFTRSLAVWEKAVGRDGPDVAYPLAGLGRTLVRLGDTDAALPLLERARALREKGRGGADPELAEPLLGLGELYVTSRKPEGAAPPLERALALHSVEFGAEIQLVLAEALWSSGAHARARTLAEEARAHYERIGHHPGLERASRWLAEHPSPG